jgi:hypothetical protein
MIPLTTFYFLTSFMLKNAVFSLALGAIFFYSCDGQKKTKKDETTFIETMEKVPFVVTRNSEYLFLSNISPDDSLHGFSVLELIINREGKISVFNIKKLLLVNVGDTLSSYVNPYHKNLKQKDYAPIIQRVYPVLEDFVTHLDIKKTGIAPEDTNRVFIMVRFK